MVISKDLTNKLSAFKNCQPFNQTKQYETQHVFNKNSTQLYECSDHKHIVLKYSTIPGYKLQIRSLEDDLRIVWETQPKSNNPCIPMIDLTQDNILIYNQIDSLTVTKFGSTQSATGKYNFVSIYDFVYNKKRDSAITGYVKTIYQDSSSQHIIGFIVVSNINNKKTTIFQHEVTIFDYSYLLSESKIRLNQNSTKILLSYTETYAERDRQIQIQVWNIQGNQLVFQLQRSGSGVEFIQFLNQTHFIIKIDNNTEIISYQSVQQPSSSFNQGILSSNQVILQFNKFSQSLPDFQKIVLSNDGSIMALLTDSLKGIVIIFDNQTEIGKIELENASIISDLLFDSNNKLYIIDNSTKIFIFSKSSCGKTFIDVNSYCQCRANLTLIDTLCQCQQNFENQNENSCICTGSDKCFYQNQCIFCSFMCSECEGPGLSCTSFSVWFYVICIGGPLILICTVIAVIKRNKNKKKKGQHNVKISEASSKDLLIDQSLDSQLRN